MSRRARFTSPGLATALQYLRLQRDRPASQVLPGAIEVAWEAAWRDEVKARLSEIIKTTGGQLKPGLLEREFGRNGDKPEYSDPNKPAGTAEALFSQRAKTASKPLWEAVPQVQLESDSSTTGSRFELQGPFSK